MNLPLPPGPPPDEARLSIQAWNLCAGEFWPALPVLCEMFGIIDVEKFVIQLATIRDRPKNEQ